jgi:RNA polymerase sigma-70 factor (ECF subfamily)
VLTDRELVLQLQKGDLTALGDLFDRHQRLVFRTAVGITGDEQVASDLLQDVFLRMHRFARHIDPDRPLEPWLYRTTANLTYTWMKRHKRWLRPLEDVAEWLAGSSKQLPANITETDEEWRDVKKAIASLSLQQRVVVVLYYINDLSLQEISEILDVPVGTIKSRLFYGRQALKKYLETGSEKHGEVNYEFT